MKLQKVNGTFICFDDAATIESAKIADRQVIDVEIIKAKKRRTLTQNNAIHRWCELVAAAMDAAGISRVITMPSGKAIQSSWSTDAVKRDIWHTIQFAQFGTKSTADLESNQVSAVYETINRDVLAEINIFVPFPDWRELAK